VIHLSILIIFKDLSGLLISMDINYYKAMITI
jgi:hypothetical protein